MSAQPGSLKPASQDRTMVPALLFVTLCASLLLIFKAPDFWTVLTFESWGLVRSLALNAHSQALSVLRYEAELCRNLVARIPIEGEWLPILMEPRPLSFTTRIRTALTVAACDVSVIIPALNEEKYLPKCLESLVSQSRRENAEIIVVDGGSTDGTVQLAKEHADKVLVEQGRPVGAGRNAGARQAEGEILAFIDADTVASFRWLEEITSTFCCNSTVVGVTGPTLPYEGTRLDRVAYQVATGWAQRFSLRMGVPHVAGFNCAYRKESFWKTGGFDEYRVLSEDVKLSLRMRHQGRILFNPEMIAYTSLRRIRKHGYSYLATYYGINEAMILLFDRTLEYPAVR